MTVVLVTFVSQFWLVLTEMAPYLLLGFFVAGLMSVFLPTGWVERHLGGLGIGPVVKATALGIPLPLCSCGVIPVAASLRRHGATKGATTAFLISTPETGVDSILVTFGLLGWVFATFRVLASLVNGLVGGLAVSLADRRSANGGTPDVPVPCQDDCCLNPHGRGKLGRAMKYGFVTLAADVGPHLLVGLGVAGVIAALVPESFFTEYLGRGIVAMLVMMALGIPVYVCASASVPIAVAMIAKGVSPGAALVFLMTGPATNAATIAAVWKILGKGMTAVYLASIAVTALVAGLVLDWILQVAAVTPGPQGASLIPDPVKVACAVVLLAVLVNAIVKPFARRAAPVSCGCGHDEREDAREDPHERGTGV